MPVLAKRDYFQRLLKQSLVQKLRSRVINNIYSHNKQKQVRDYLLYSEKLAKVGPE